EQLVDSVRVVTAGRVGIKERLFRSRTSTALTRALGKPASRNEISTGRPDSVAVVQALELLNGDEFSGMLAAGGLLGELAGLPDHAAAIDRLFLTTLSHRPTDAERDEAAAYVRSAVEQGSVAKAEPTDVVLLEDDPPEGAALSPEWRWV